MFLCWNTFSLTWPKMFQKSSLCNYSAMVCYQRMVNNDFVQHTRGQEFRNKVQQISVNVFIIVKVVILRDSDAQKGYWSAMNCTCKL